LSSKKKKKMLIPNDLIHLKEYLENL